MHVRRLLVSLALAAPLATLTLGPSFAAAASDGPDGPVGPTWFHTRPSSDGLHVAPA